MRAHILLTLIFASSIALGQPKFAERTIQMRDGAVLAADLYIRDSSIKKPTILIQTPYNKNFFRIAVNLPQGGGLSLPYDSLKYNYVIADWRGFFGSKNAAKPAYDRGLDGYDLVEWIAAQSWSDGKIGTWGGSALGLIQFQTAKHRPPHLVCAMPFIIDYKTEYQKFYPGGVFLREHYDMVESLGLVSNDLILAHPTYDLYWKAAEQLTNYPDSINVPLLMLTGWFDHFPDAVIRGYETLRARSDASVRDKHKLVIGPWIHTKVGTAEQGILSYPEAAGIPTDLALQFFGFYLLGQETAWEAGPGVRYFDLGTHQWHTAGLWADELATAEIKRLYFNASTKSLSTEQPLSGALTYDYDPRDPSPSIGSSTFNDTLLHGPQDISQTIEARNDVITLSTDVLSEDLVIRGAINAQMWVSTDRLDTDFGVRLCDVFPDGRSVIITDAMHRLRFRDGFETQKLVTPQDIVPITVTLRNLAITFKKGHRLRIDITSSNFPRFDLNPNSGGALYQPGDTLVAKNTIMMSSGINSLLSLPVITPSEVKAEPLEDVRVYPNPTEHTAMISFTSEDEGYVQWDLYDGMGRIAANGSEEIAKGPTVVVIPLAGLADGVYYVKLSGHKKGFLRVIKGFGP